MQLPQVASRVESVLVPLLGASGLLSVCTSFTLGVAGPFPPFPPLRESAAFPHLPPLLHLKKRGSRKQGKALTVAAVAATIRVFPHLLTFTPS